MAVRARGRRWQVDVSVKGRRRTATCVTEADARVREAELRLDLLAPRHAHQRSSTRPVWSLGEAWTRTYEVAWRDTPYDAGMVKMRRQLFDHWGEDTPLDLITTDKVDAWIAALIERGNSNGTINRKLAALSKITRIAGERPERSGYATADRPVFRRKKEPFGRIREVSLDEEVAMLTFLYQCGYVDHEDAIVMLLDTGIRCGELWRLEARDVDFEKGFISIWQTKTDLPRGVPMTKRVRVILDRRIGSGARADRVGRIFPYSNAWLRPVWARLRMHLGLEDDPQFVPHILRHTCACRLVQRGVRLEVVRDWLGHKSFAMTLRYARLAPKNLLEAARVLEPVGGDDV